MSYCSRLFIVGLLAITGATSAHGDGKWKSNISHRFSGSASLKVHGDSGLSIVVEFNGNRLTDTSPAIFNLPNQDQYVTVSASKGGSKWQQKIEMRKNHQTVLELRAAAAKAKRVTVRVKNRTHRCSGVSEKRRINVVFIRDGKEVTRTNQIRPGTFVQVVVDAGGYDLKYYVQRGSRMREYSTSHVELTKNPSDVIFFKCF